MSSQYARVSYTQTFDEAALCGEEQRQCPLCAKSGSRRNQISGRITQPAGFRLSAITAAREAQRYRQYRSPKATVHHRPLRRKIRPHPRPSGTAL
jgi:hypothetical protein